MAPKKILVIDDEPHILMMVSARLKANGYEVITADDGEDGLEKLKSDLPDIILLDLMMPRMDGYEFLRQIKEIQNTKGIAIVIFTAKVRREDIDKAISLGAMDYIIKPFTPEILLGKIHSVLSKK